MPQNRIGILGGTFDPIHNGHLSLAQSAMQAMSLDEVLFMPTGNPHFKLDQDVTDARNRVEMVRLALAGRPRFTLDTREVEREGITYTADTLEELAGQYPDSELFFIIGADSAATLAQWRRAADVARLAHFVVAPRPGIDLDRALDVLRESQLGFDLVVLDDPQPDISSSEIRRRASLGADLGDCVPQAVADYIASQGLYSDVAACS